MTGRQFLGDASGGLTGGITSATGSIAVGLVASAPLGAQLGGTGMLAICYGVVLGGAVFLPLRRTPGLQPGGTLPMALVVAGAVSALLAQGVPVLGPGGAAGFLGVMILLTGLSALAIAALALTGLGRLVPMIPFPVMAGLVNGGAVLMVLGQYRQALGLVAAHAGAWPHPGALAVSGATFLLTSFPPRPIRAVPPVLLGIVGGAAVHYLLAALVTADFSGPVLGPLPNGLGQLRDVAAGWAMLPDLPLTRMVSVLLPAALSIAMLATLDTMMGASTMQDVSGVHRSAQTDLLAMAMGNLAGGALGALPISCGNNPSMVVWNAGGRTWLAGVIRIAVVLAVVLLLPALMALLPLAVVAGIVIGSAWRLVDRESLGYARLAFRRSVRQRREMIGNVVIVLVVVGVAATYGMAIAVLAGGVLSLLLFVAAMAQSAVRRRYAGVAGRSRTARPRGETEILLASSALIEVVELQGALFFGSGDQVARGVEAALARGARHIILDMRRVTSVDLSGARRLLQIAERYWHGGCDLAIACLRPGTPVWEYLHDLDLLSRLRPDRVFSALEDAAEHAERQLLAASPAVECGGPQTRAGALEAIGLPAGLAAELAPRLPLVEIAAGEPLIRAGERSDAFFILVAGALDVLVTLPAGVTGARQSMRLLTLMPGLMVGEMAFLSGAPRSADVVARTQATCLRVEAAVVETLRRSDPEIAYYLMRAIAGQVERNLRMANAALLSLEE